MKKQRKVGRMCKKPSKEVFELMYYNPNMTVYELADHYGVKPQTIYNWANEYRKKENNTW